MSPDKLKGMRVLVVDDNSSSREILKEALCSLPFIVEAASSGIEAIEQVKRALPDKPYQLILMDWKMPVMDGIETAGQIKAHTKLYHIPKILMVTAYGREEVRQKAETAGIDGFLIKPVTPTVLFDTVMDILDKPTGDNDCFLKEKTSVVEGLNERRGARVAGNRKLYINLLQQYLKKYLLMPDHIKRAMDRAEPDITLQLAHTLKGVAGNIGALVVFAVAEQLEIGIKQNLKESIAGLMQQLSRENERVVSSLEKWFADGERIEEEIETNSGNHHPADKSRLGPFLLELGALLRENNSEALNRINELKIMIGHEYQNELTQVETYVDDLEFDKALKVIETLAGKLEP